MRTASKKLILSLASALYVLMSTTPLYADDTELYTGVTPGAITARPNVLFIIDTSGSMGTNVTLTTGTYDPATTYTGDCDSAYYYWSSTGSTPSCTGWTIPYIATSSFKCDDAVSALSAGGTGFYLGRMARYRLSNSGDYWTTFTSWDHDDIVECEADYGVHGDGVNTTNLWPANESNGGPWRGNTNNSISWAATGGAYTVYTANYINFVNTAGNSITLTRLEIVQQVLKDIIDSTSGINAALMRYDASGSSLGGSFIEPMQEINSTTRTGFKASIDSLTDTGATPLAETLYEAMLYYRGEHVHFGDTAVPANVSTVLDPNDNSRYLSPIEFQCQNNFIVMLTDGEPTYDSDADSLINNGNQGAPFNDNFPGVSDSCGYSADDCLDELAGYMYDFDQINTLADKQNIITYTIGFATDQQLLMDTARAGGSSGGNIDPSVGYFTTESITGLTDAFTSIISDIQEINTTFVSPAVSVNAFNRLAHRSELYFALFRPTTRYRWPGNLKRYELARATAGDPDSELIIKDVNGAPAVDLNTGFFDSNAQSFWSTNPDGADVTLGGAAENLPLANRRVYTFTGANSALVPPQTDTETLNTATNLLHENNDASVTGGTLTNTLLGLDATTTDADRISLIKWARGVDVLDEDEDNSTSDARNFMGDPLHSKPQMVNYQGTNETDTDITIYMITNEGFLHAIDADTGVEQFAFMPQDLLPNLSTLKNNTTAATRTYGLDGPMTIWHNDLNNDLLVLDSNGDPQVTNGVAEHVYLYFGMRRGGKNYYALDVTDRNNPKLKWKIEGGIPGDDFEELGQTWSKMDLATIKYAGQKRTVLIFGGGYDTNVDNVTTPADDNMGRAIFIVDAETGERLWWASITGSGADLELADMKNAITADMTAFDSTGDGYVDRIYTADLAARIWRFDIDNNTTSGTPINISGGVIADLNGSALGNTAAATAANNRHFYYAPSVAYIRDGSQEYFTIAIGSGYRSHPTNTTIEDRFYVIRDTNVRGPERDANDNPIYTAINEDDLFDATDNIIGEGTTTEINAARQSLNTNNGWYIRLNEPDGSFIGEKVLGRAVTFNSILLFSTFTPIDSGQSNSCSPSQGVSAAWAVNLLDAKPVFNFDQSNPDLTRGDRKGTLNMGGLPADPSIVFFDGEVTAFFGTLKLNQAGDGLGIKAGLLPEGYVQPMYWNVNQ